MLLIPNAFFSQTETVSSKFPLLPVCFLPLPPNLWITISGTGQLHHTIKSLFIGRLLRHRLRLATLCTDSLSIRESVNRATRQCLPQAATPHITRPPLLRPLLVSWSKLILLFPWYIAAECSTGIVSFELWNLNAVFFF